MARLTVIKDLFTAKTGSLPKNISPSKNTHVVSVSKPGAWICQSVISPILTPSHLATDHNPDVKMCRPHWMPVHGIQKYSNRSIKGNWIWGRHHPSEAIPPVLVALKSAAKVRFFATRALHIVESLVVRFPGICYSMRDRLAVDGEDSALDKHVGAFSL